MRPRFHPVFKWGYNDRSELITADRHLGSTPDTPGTRMTPGDYDYVYDPIGNRTSYRLDVDPSTYYCTNAVNQYTATDDAFGTCPTPPSPTEQFTYDEDGNLTQDGRFTYGWDAENRLVSVAPVGTPAAGDKRLGFAYDHMSRRVRKRVETYQSGAWIATEDLRFVYDGWNVVEVLSGTSNTLTRKYTWGLDLSGLSGSSTAAGIHEAGGIGGLLACVEAGGTHAGSYWFFYDANGNVGQAITASDLTLAAHYEYDPYGNAIMSSGSYAAANPFRFSTKWFDAAPGLYYYGYRYYSPAQGRWFARDPVNEPGRGLSSQQVSQLLQPDLIQSVALHHWLLGSAGSTPPRLIRGISVDANTYVYSQNRVTYAIDPLGLQLRIPPDLIRNTDCPTCQEKCKTAGLPPSVCGEVCKLLCTPLPPPTPPRSSGSIATPSYCPDDCHACPLSGSSCDYYRCRVSQTRGRMREYYQLAIEVCEGFSRGVNRPVDRYRKCLQECDRDLCPKTYWGPVGVLAGTEVRCHVTCLRVFNPGWPTIN